MKWFGMKWLGMIGLMLLSGLLFAGAAFAADPTDTTLSDQNNVEMWSFLVGALLPPLIAIVQQPGWSTKMRAAITVVTCIGAAAITTWLTTGFSFDADLVGSILRTIVAAQATYLAFWKKTGLTGAIEDKTSGVQTTPA
jgi:hypothetical protein